MQNQFSLHVLGSGEHLMKTLFSKECASCIQNMDSGSLGLSFAFKDHFLGDLTCVVQIYITYSLKLVEELIILRKKYHQIIKIRFYIFFKVLGQHA